MKIAFLISAYKDPAQLKSRLGMNVYTEEPNILNENDKCFFYEINSNAPYFF